MTAENGEPYRQSAEETIATLATDPARGLSSQEADARLRLHGPNELASERPASAWRKFLAQFTDILVILLLAAAAVSASLWLYERDAPLPFEAIAILAIVMLNALLGFFQEAKAAQAVAALRTMAAAHANVIRDGERTRIPARAVVPGDILLVEEGDTVAADVRLIETVALQAAEAALTGESLPAAKDMAAIDHDVPLGDRRNMLFSGTAVTFGRGRAVVTATGMQSQIGRIAGMIENAPAQTTPLQRELARVGRLLGIIVMAIALVMIATILTVEDVHGFSAVFEVLILGVALAVAAVPEGLPAIVTAVLSLGVQRMAGRNAIVRHLAAVETLGSATVIASDKTGTLTRNEMTVRIVATASGRITLAGTGYAPEGAVSGEDGSPIEGDLQTELRHVLAVALCANNAALQHADGRWIIRGDPTEGALIVAARKAGIEADGRAGRIGEIPFSSERKLMSVVHGDPEGRAEWLVLTKGAPDTLLSRCTCERVGAGTRPLTQARRAEIRAMNDALAGGALRTLGMACRPLPSGASPPIDEELERDLTFLGLVGMIDPPRDEARDAIARAKGAGIRPIMITGDHPITASVIAAELGISDDGRAVTGAQIAAMTEGALDETVRSVSVFARVDPDHKLRIVRALQRDGMIVAMTGDGVNDAPALTTADIGIAMGITGTDVSRQAADIVLADDNFASIVAAVEEGRAIYANIRKFLRYLLSSNIGEVMTMFFGVLLADAIGLTASGDSGLVLPLLATQILWINLVTDGTPALALGIDPAGRHAMHEPPRPRDERVITTRMWAGILFVGAIMAAGTLLMLDAGLPGGFIEGTGTPRHAQTMAFLTLTMFQLFNLFNARSDMRSAFRGMFSNPWLWAAIGLSLLLQAGVIYLPFLQQAFSTTSLRAGDWLACAAVASSVLWLREASKIAAAWRPMARKLRSRCRLPDQRRQ